MVVLIDSYEFEKVFYYLDPCFQNIANGTRSVEYQTKHLIFFYVRHLIVGS